ncbi:stage II sporulation protein R (pro-sigma-E processing factor) [Oceanobacillus iheyensis HTE831]|uniref:Stage II sporulation protein R (Pro-sigma-E processing factor) n=1 Tax=Oceanobacillus iheyensis (strain DSM 14371 / CIP 107618 / JCM 11309 / KCTC 3954 / HTE831) TaxID=221109 RepID=Q8EM62_OCEIH|nr:stage II sporulation protein R [Oceanobacillus iheyensis]BAC14952.1 stage II sporulation protein R (pro-sigma-E processing factor) [Oceanobacillus iheyensis HTE831]
MKKLWLLFGLLVGLFFLIPLVAFTSSSEENNEFQVIPDEAIRLRILANSDNDRDQEIKHKVRDEINEVVTEWVQDIDDIEEARQLIQSRISELETVVDEVLNEEGEEVGYAVEYGDNISFPAKLYGNYLYPAGEYEAILVTLGEGSGSNWWCVLFPPLCFLDFFNGTSVAAEGEEQEVDEVEEEETEVKFFLFEWLGWS